MNSKSHENFHSELDSSSELTMQSSKLDAKFGAKIFEEEFEIFK